MPNTEVKLTNAESTWLEAAREDRKLLINKKRTLKGVSFFIVYKLLNDKRVRFLETEHR